MEIRPASWDDADGVFDLLATRGRAVYGISDWRLAHVQVEWHQPTFEVGRDNWVALDGGRVVGYAAVNATQDLQHAALDAVAGDELLGRAVTRARERGFDVIRIILSPADEPLYALAERHGFELETEIVRMWKRLDGGDPLPVWPDGVTVRSYLSDDAPNVKSLLDEAYIGWDAAYLPMTADDWTHWMTKDDQFDPLVWFLAEEHGALVACALHWRTGWLKDVAVRDSDRGRGLAKALLLHAFAEFGRRGVDRIGLKADTGNPTGALQLYERLGFVEDRREELRALWL